ncbi:response regulator transcription factor [Flavihumibacter sp. CACIAM 22H1]|uniref:response regulator n=1 Tax=Flavihumibacter sp. CACIAM 22H1 TaxID=1812911 RepID=UPI0007A92BDD|nr:response regulator transcription factor [Flavihumibacter sp. CACIAM 22H1]KYP14464.1 MAG: DNA-binding response regulator [Flavihumibacter sp. CACIAM 22H1]
MKEPVRIILFEDNPILRESLVNLLALTGEYHILGSYPDCTEVEVLVQEVKPDVILMDIDMPGVNGIEAVSKIRRFNQQVQIIMLTVFDDNSHVFDAMYAGANGYLLKKYISDKLIYSIQEVLQGGAPMSPSIARLIISSLQQPVVAAKDYQLTNREKEILQLLSNGNSFKMIASELTISLDTVRTHIKHIYDKLHVRSQIEAVSKAITEKLVK